MASQAGTGRVRAAQRGHSGDSAHPVGAGVRGHGACRGAWTLTGGSLRRTRALASGPSLGRGRLCPHSHLSSGQLAPLFPRLAKQEWGSLTVGFSVRRLGRPGLGRQRLQTFLVVVTRGAGIWRVEAREAAETLQWTRGRAAHLADTGEGRPLQTESCDYCSQCISLILR